MVGNMSNIAAASISHLYNFTGPALAIDTACSSFLVALTQAVAAIQDKRISGAVVGGASILATPHVHQLSRNAGICSSTQHTKVFDQGADGSVIGEGAVVVYLEPLTEAVRTNKHIYGLIRGTAVNNDGYSLGIMAPNPQGQYEVLRAAYNDANLNPKEISYIEAHGGKCSTPTVSGEGIRGRNFDWSRLGQNEYWTFICSIQWGQSGKSFTKYAAQGTRSESTYGSS
jgi:acyl transferase domain-containing protein